ncbi:carboxymuconolactone decarboxylase family protein [Enterobacillus tribolii]|uniref:Alkylhydroperoxidase family enzyme n=1 Tax=Enterobacillus tribolii TaxID=1487935 RepID=A0A370QRJ0_9GAMM|nr:carboxymuconolactone decarboxylase family protein [Enterobacillus tribolii]MBW7983627.1 carboxymuconolactone decarboxylase family protein [Enterobacillus tribolii]RDK91874.1 alkylhydroperoxidase family enzyme [Enterobacillus tribolii]
MNEKWAMSWVSSLKKLPCSLWPLVRAQQKHYGETLNPTRWWGRFPFLFWLVALFVGFLERRKSTLAPELRALVMTRVSQRCDCAFCIDANSLRLAQRSGSAEKVMALKDWPQQHGGVFSAAEEAALAYADAVTATPPVVSGQIKAALKTHFSDEAITELTALIAFQNLSARFNAALEIPGQGLCVIEPAKKGDEAPHA